MKTDAQLKKDVVDELTWDPAVLAINIGIEVKNGIVTLAGEVDTCTEKWNAERDLATRSAWGSAGVSKVLNHMNLVY